MGSTGTGGLELGDARWTKRLIKLLDALTAHLTARILLESGGWAETKAAYRVLGWLIEIFFRILKSGCRVEALQLGTLERLERALVLYLIIAWRLLHRVFVGNRMG